MNPPEAFLLDFHRVHPGCTSEAFASGKTLKGGESSYQLLASLAPGQSVLDLGSGDGHLLQLVAALSERSVGLDFSPDELKLARSASPRQAVVRGRGQELPFADASFSLVLSHLAFHLMADPKGVVAEIGRVLSSAGQFAAVVGGGPKLGDAFELFLELMLASRNEDQKLPRIGAQETRADEGLRRLFAECPAFQDEIEIEDYYVDFGGSFDQVWRRVSTTYDLRYFEAEQLEELRSQFRDALAVKEDEHIPCTMAIRRVLATRLTLDPAAKP